MKKIILILAFIITPAFAGGEAPSVKSRIGAEFQKQNLCIEKIERYTKKVDKYRARVDAAEVPSTGLKWKLAYYQNRLNYWIEYCTPSQ